MSVVETYNRVQCYHCGEDVRQPVVFDDKKFCCVGCQSVYTLLSNNNLCAYYHIAESPGRQAADKQYAGKYYILDHEDTAAGLLNFKNDTESHVNFYIPYMHCSSCIFLLENLQRFHDGIISGRVNFQKKEIEIVFHHHQIGLKEIALLLQRIGYPPHISLASENEGTRKNFTDRSQIYKIGIAGFAFGNIMMLSFPEYFHLSNFSETAKFSHVFNILSLLLALPVLFYCAAEFFTSAFTAIKQRVLNIDAPIALAIIITFLRSLYEITYGSKVGYFDSMTGIVFFMLLGRYFQNRTYNFISFERDYKSYFPLGVSVVEKINGEDVEKTIPVSAIKPGMRLLIRQHELIPADAILFNGNALVDYSFVTGEAAPVSKTLGEILYAGGKQKGGQIEVEVIKDVSQSYLTSLWNKDAKHEQTNKETSVVNTINKYFSFALLVLSAGAFFYWWPIDIHKALNAVTTILIVACPCALLLSATFTYGNVLQILAKHNFYIKNASAVERLSEADTIVFDKTGTLTTGLQSQIVWEGQVLSADVKQMIAALAKESIHPLSRHLVRYLNETKKSTVDFFEEHAGRGITGIVLGHEVKLGSAKYVGNTAAPEFVSGSNVYVAIDGLLQGCFKVNNKYREGVPELLNELNQKGYDLHLLSGDNDKEKKYLKYFFNEGANLHFNQSPQQKFDYVQALTKAGRKVVMIGDGLNDAGALMQSYAGIAVTDDINYFTPACSAILEGNKISKLNQFLTYTKSAGNIIKASFVLSLIYNAVGLSYALSGTLQPVIAAILMPLSTVSIVWFTTVCTTLYARKKLGNETIILN